MQKLRLYAITLLIVCALGYSLLNVAVRMMGDGFGPITQTYIRICTGAVIGTVLFWRKIRLDTIKTISKRDWIILLLMGIVGYGLMVFFITLGALNTKLINVSVIYATVTFFTYIYSIFVLKTQFKLRILIYLAFSIWGVSIIATKSLFPQFEQFGIGEFFVLLSALSGAWYYVGRKMLSIHLNTYEIALVTMYIAGISTFLLSLFFHEPLDLKALLNTTVFIGFFIGSVFNVIATSFEMYSFSHIEAVLGSQILLLENVFALVFGFLLYKEIIGQIEWLGAILIIFCVYLMNKYLYT